MPRSRTLAQLAVVALLVTASLGGPAVDQARAVHSCDSVDALVAMFSFGHVNKDKCTNNHVSHVVKDMKESDANQEKLDLYEAALSQRANTRAKLDVRENYLEDSQTPAWSKGEAAYMEARENGTSHAIARARARSAVRDYYAHQQVNFLRNWNTTVAQFRYLRSVARQEDGISPTFLTVGYSRDRGYSEDHRGLDIQGFPTVEVPLANGSTVNTTGIRIEACDMYGVTGPHCTRRTLVPSRNNDEFTTNGLGDTLATYDITGLKVQPPNEDYSAAVYTDIDRWQQIWTKLVDTQDRLNDNINTFTDRINQGIQNGTVDPANATSALTLASEYSQQYNETGYWSYSVARLASMGMAAPDLNETSQMTIQSGGQTYTGLLMSQQNPPNGSWEVGRTYDAGNISGMQIFVTTDGARHELEGSFTITGMKDENGTAINATSAHQYSYQTVNTSGYQELQKELTALRLEIEEQEPSAGGPGSGSGQPLGDQAGLLLAGAGAVLVLLMLSSRD